MTSANAPSGLRYASPPQLAGGPFQPVPLGPGQPPYRIDLARLAPGSRAAAGGPLALQVIGDCGPEDDRRFQTAVARGLIADYAAAPVPALLYILGDVVYNHGEAARYPAQFDEPYRDYPAPIVAVPGNHDGDPRPVTPDSGLPPEPSLTGFRRTFCRESAQPNPYWTLRAPQATVIGVYSNVPEGGVVDDSQRAWLTGELAAAPADRPLLLCLHHPPYSADTVHCGSPTIGALIDAVSAAAGRGPDLVLAGHVHNYQRFTRDLGGGVERPYLVVGTGGAWNLYPIGTLDPVPPPPHRIGDVTLETYSDDRHGFLRLEIDGSRITGRYYTVPQPDEPWTGPRLFDRFSLDCAGHRLVR